MRRLSVAALLLTGCYPKHTAPWTAEIEIVGDHPAGLGPAWDPDLPPLDPQARMTRAQARATAHAASQVVTTRTGRWWPILALVGGDNPFPPVDEPSLERDAAAVQSWFVDRGWTDATVELSINPETVWWARRSSYLWRTATLHVEVGHRQIVRERTIEGEEDLPITTRAALVRLVPHRADAISPAILARVSELVHAELSAAGHPFGTVDLLTTPAGDQGEVDLRCHILPGPAPAPGQVHVVGTTRLKADRVAEAVERTLGPTWDGRHTAIFLQRLRDQPVITSVEAQAVPAGSGAADVVLRLSEQPGSSFKASFSLYGPSTLLAAGVDLAATARLGRLSQLKTRTLVSWRLFDGPPGAFLSGAQTGPGLTHDTQVAVPIRPLSRFDLLTGLKADLTSWRGYTVTSGLAEAGLRLRMSRQLSAWAQFRGGGVYHFPLPWQAEPFERFFSTDGQLATSYDVLAAVIGLRYDGRDRPSLPRRGLLLDAEIIPYGTSRGNPWHRLALNMRGYATLLPDRLVLATRFAAGVHIIDDTAPGSSLLSNRFFLGGMDGPRGFGARRLGPPGSYAGLDGVMAGGDSMMQASVELQWMLHPDVMTSAFVDVGRTWESGRDQYLGGVLVQRGVHLVDLQPTAGLGLVLRTPAGGLAAWLGVRLRPEIDVAGDLPRVAIHVALAPDF